MRQKAATLPTRAKAARVEEVADFMVDAAGERYAGACAGILVLGASASAIPAQRLGGERLSSRAFRDQRRRGRLVCCRLFEIAKNCGGRRVEDRRVVIEEGGGGAARLVELCRGCVSVVCALRLLVCRVCCV